MQSSTRFCERRKKRRFTKNKFFTSIFCQCRCVTKPDGERRRKVVTIQLQQVSILHFHVVHHWHRRYWLCHRPQSLVEVVGYLFSPNYGPDGLLWQHFGGAVFSFHHPLLHTHAVAHKSKVQVIRVLNL
eukprot:Pompholyxophrys_sp_v1_NODE_499_length_514_cov_6.590414.p2 type:complete len:129 gc:universal NODE_499_length_514_cov_6.590414:120-506(+)